MPAPMQLPTIPVLAPDCSEDCLPILDQDPHERADAARNRQKVLAAAERLFAQRGPEHVSMADVAEAAGVGKGTLFRRFGDRATLARAVLSESERRFQDRVIRGEPPLGPGAPPVERLVAFGREFMTYVDSRVDVVLAAETRGLGWRLKGGPYALYVTHVAMLIEDADPELDAPYLAPVLMNALSADIVQHLRAERGMDCARLHAGWESLVRRLLS